MAKARFADSHAWAWWGCSLCNERQLVHKSHKDKRCILTPRCEGKLTQGPYEGWQQ